MDKILKKIIKIIGIFVLVLFIAFIVIAVKAIVTIGGSSPLSEYDMDKVYYSNKAILNDVAEYLRKQDYDFIALSASKETSTMHASNGMEISQNVKITDDSVADKIKYLFEIIKYIRITKEGNGIYFQRWSGLKYGGGVVYSMDGERPQNKRLINLQPLPEKNWYFYEER
jgi:hypothetical protein